MPFLSYAQNQEDVLLHRIFGGQETGFYVDVGAYDPVNGSVTKIFYDRGWSGINIEPGEVFDKLAAARPRDVNLRMAVLDRTGEVTFFQDPADAGMSRVIDDAGEDDAENMASRRTVACDTLENILKTHSHRRPVDFLKIDAEGTEAAIIRSTDWRRVRPRVVLIEATLPWSSNLFNEDWEPTLLEQGYVRIYFDGLNCFYIPEEERPALARLFQAPVNVLDRARQYDPAAEAITAERDEFAARVVAGDAERGKLQASLAAADAERDGLKAHLTETVAERDELRSRLAAAEAQREQTQANLVRVRDLLTTSRAEHQETHRALEATATERDALFAKAETAAAEREEVESVLEATQAAHAGAVESVALHSRYIARLESDLAAAVADRDTLAETLRNLESAPPPPPILAAQETAPVEMPVQLGVVPSRPLGKRVLRRSARLAYGLVRPVVRSAAWRLRGFLIEPLIAQAAYANARTGAALGEALTTPGGIDILQGELHRLAHEVSRLPQSSGGQAEPAGLSELRRLAETMEHALLTLATSAAHDSPSAPWPAEKLVHKMPLHLPGDREVELEVVAGDISVSAALTASGGVWEPHVQRFMAGLVKPDWVCADIGANIGVHTLGLATLAYQGKVYAFEADSANFAVLSRNASALSPPAGNIEAMHFALWDRPGVLTIGGADELSGCSFVRDGEVGADEIERQLRTVVSAEALSGTELHVHRSEVKAVPLDEWAESLTRLDFIKLDVEGAEAWVVRGADRTLWRHRPVLLVEYNPACAAAYFNEPADGLYRELQSRFHSIHVLENNGDLTGLADWNALEARLQAGKGWEDLVCLPAAN